MAKRTKDTKRKVATATRRARKQSSSNVPAARLSKKDLILRMLHAETGATMAALSESTGWQSHSIRAFFTKEVRRRERLNLVSEMIDGERVYRIATRSLTAEQ